MKREILEYLVLHAKAVELKLHDSFNGTTFEMFEIASATFAENTVVINGYPYMLNEIIGVRFIGTEDEILEEIENADTLEKAIMFTDPDHITARMEIALNKKRDEIRAKADGSVREELEMACKARGIAVERVLKFIRANYGVDTENDWQGVKSCYNKAIEKIAALPFK